MTKKTTRAVIEGVWQALEMGSRSIQEIAGLAKTNWATAQRQLELLKSMELVSEKEENGKRLFSRTVGSRKTNTLFGIPISKEDENTINYIYMQARKIWRERNNSPLSKTHAQKILANVNIKCSLNLPLGWYLYGEVCVKPYDPSEEYGYEAPQHAAKLRGAVETSIDGFRGQQKVWQLERDYYRKRGKELYILKNELAWLLYKNFSKDKLENFCNGLLRLLVNVRKEEDTQGAVQALTELIALSFTALNAKKFSLDEKFVASLADTFREVWKHIALFEFCASLAETKKFDEEQLWTRFTLSSLDQSWIVQQQLAELTALINSPVSEPQNEEEKKLKALQGSVKSQL